MNKTRLPILIIVVSLLLAAVIALQAFASNEGKPNNRAGMGDLQRFEGQKPLANTGPKAGSRVGMGDLQRFEAQNSVALTARTPAVALAWAISSASKLRNPWPTLDRTPAAASGWATCSVSKRRSLLPRLAAESAWVTCSVSKRNRRVQAPGPASRKVRTHFPCRGAKQGKAPGCVDAPWRYCVSGRIREPVGSSPHANIVGIHWSLSCGSDAFLPG